MKSFLSDRKKPSFSIDRDLKQLLNAKIDDDKRTEAEARLYAIEKGLNEEEYLETLKQEKLNQKTKIISILLKGDSSGSIEALKGQIDSFPKTEINVIVARTGIGAITEQDIKVANERGLDRLVVLGFNVAYPPAIKALASRSGVLTHTFDVIYDLIHWIKNYCSKFLDPLTISQTVALLLVKEIFMISVKSTKVKIAGCLVKTGIANRGADIEIRREGETIFSGKIRQLRHLKEDVKSVTTGRECGVMVSENFQDFEEGDVIHIMEYQQKLREFEIE